MCESCDNELSRVQNKKSSHIEFDQPKYEFQIECKKIHLRWKVFDLKDDDYNSCDAEIRIDLYGLYRNEPNKKIHLEKDVPCDKTWGNHRVVSLTCQ